MIKYKKEEEQLFKKEGIFVNKNKEKTVKKKMSIEEIMLYYFVFNILQTPLLHAKTVIDGLNFIEKQVFDKGLILLVIALFDLLLMSLLALWISEDVDSIGIRDSLAVGLSFFGLIGAYVLNDYFPFLTMVSWGLLFVTTIGVLFCKIIYFKKYFRDEK